MGIGILVLFSQVFSFLNSSLGLVGDARLTMGIANRDSFPYCL